MDYEKLDKQIRINYRKDRIEQAKELGYNYISECVIKEYHKLKSMRKVANLLQLSTPCINYELMKWKIKRYPKGGIRPGDIRHGRHWWNPLSTNTRDIINF